MFNISLENPSAIERFALANETLNRATTNWLTDMAIWIKADLKRRVPVKTGQLRNSVRYELQRNENGGEATFHSVWYGALIDEGTKPFTIQAAPGKPLSFMRGGERVFTMTIRNPGIKPRNFTLDTLEGASTEADRLADEVAANVIRAVM